MDWPLFALAVEDYVPVVLSGLGLWVLAKESSRVDVNSGGVVRAGLVLVVVGGLTKPVYKTLLAVSGGDLDVAVLDALLFWFLAPGFLVVSSGLTSAHRIDRTAGSFRLWIGVAAASVVLLAAAATFFVSPTSRNWFFTLLTAATVGNVWMIVVLVRWSRHRGDRLAAWLFVTNLVIVFGLAGSATVFPQTIPVQWGEQIASTAAQGCFLWASVRMVGALEQRSGRAGVDVV